MGGDQWGRMGGTDRLGRGNNLELKGWDCQSVIGRTFTARNHSKKLNSHNPIPHNTQFRKHSRLAHRTQEDRSTGVHNRNAHTDKLPTPEHNQQTWSMTTLFLINIITADHTCGACTTQIQVQDVHSFKYRSPRPHHQYSYGQLHVRIISEEIQVRCDSSNTHLSVKLQA